MWALLPLAARDRLGVDAGGYGALFGALGVGAVVAALAVGRLRDKLSTNALLAISAACYAGALVVVVAVPIFVLAMAALVVAGMAWAAVISTFIAELQVFLPGWVRARALAVYLVIFTGSQALASVVWGQVADQVGVLWTFVAGAALVLVGTLAGAIWRLPETGHLSNEASNYWPDARLAVEPPPSTGPVLITVTYTVDNERQAAYLAAMQELRRSRRRSGSTRWALYHDAEYPDRYVEVFQVGSWEEHLRQHEGRLTLIDQQVEEAALAFSDPPASAQHYLPPQILP